MEINGTTLKELYQVRDNLNRIISQMENGSTVYANNERVSVPRSLVSNQPVLIPKDLPYLEELLRKTTNPASKKFISSVIDSKYPTMTVKQKEIIDQIEEQIR
jgi:hypothetical protein